MRTRRPNLVAALTLAVLAWSATAAAQGATDSAAAQTLFDQGTALMEAGKFAEACPKLAESQRLDPAGGTLLHLATCHEQEGKLATAWAEFREAIDLALRDRRADRESFARKHVDALASKLARLTIHVEATPPAGLEVRRDGVVIAAPSWGTPLPVDRGAHVVEAAAPGRKPWRAVVELVGDGAATSITVPHLEDAADAAAGPPAGAPERPWQRPLGIGLAGVGAAGVVLGTVFGIVAKSKHDEALSRCTLGPAGTGCSAQAVAIEDSARSAGDVSTVAFIAGGIALAGGVVLWVTAPTASSAPRVAITANLSPNRAGLLVTGAF